ncbi:hypothetical protein FOA43_002902 [Brettanomyces nanus]|uniref:Uncharacterized protein n=1 Tax=Eeniella nana TaxID=13502 RepID=A0A875RVH8_EENNA|nr:uncharacterized protein FOA43_002902 [Brettanomyces nanus]QPG75547.1 hypothetical protein FOA43_002902 [Brettanomyces nanus]
MGSGKTWKHFICFGAPRRAKRLAIGAAVVIVILISAQVVDMFRSNRQMASLDEPAERSSHFWPVYGSDADLDNTKEQEMIEHEEIKNHLYEVKQGSEVGDGVEDPDTDQPNENGDDGNSDNSDDNDNSDNNDDNSGGDSDGILIKYKLGLEHKAPEEAEHNAALDKFLQKVLTVLITSKPKTGFELMKRSKKQKSDTSFNLYPRQYGKNGVVNIAAHDNRPGVPVLSEDFLGQCLTMSSQVFQDLQTSHFYVTKWLPDKYPENVYKGDGVVMVGGGRYSWFVLLAVENLRSTGSKLPVEVLIPSEDEYESYLCDKLLPKLDAKCVVLTQRLPFLKKFSSIIGGYQYKSLALLSSSFERVLLLDADNLAVENPDSLFDSEPFDSYGMILWPDYWKRVTHPDFYKLAGFKIGDKRVRNGPDDLSPPELYVSGFENPKTDLPLHDREGTMPDLTTESGQIMVNKRNHMRSLLLSLYYNLYGPHQFYPLFSQGTNGEGDKETFLAAATYYGESVYRVNKICDSLGYWMDDPHKFVGVGMIQHDPVVDYKNSKDYRKYVEQKLSEFKDENPNWKKLTPQLWKSINEDSENNFNSYMDRNQRPRFYHCNFPKLDPVDMHKYNKLVDDNGKEERLYTSNELDFDFEKKQWVIMRKYFCDGDLELKYFTDAGVRTTDYCQFIDDRITFLEAN